ncbi:MAG TPA: TraB/GumN family protein [Myxococcaceae bacterium]
MKCSPPLLSLVLAALLGLGCATTPPALAPVPAQGPPAAPAERAFLWEVTSAHAQGGTAYVVGSIHLGRPGELSFPASMEAAFTRSDALVVEVDVGAVDAVALQRFILEQGVLPPGERLSERLDPETAKLLGPAAERVGLPLAGLERMRPWVVSVTLSVMELQRAGYQSGLGVDRVFLDRARGVMDIVELESAEGQLRMLASLPEPLQDAMLRDQLSRSEQLTQGLERITQAWKAGDAEGMEALVFRDQTDPALGLVYEKLFDERNARMAEALGKMLAQRRTWFVVVGAGHVVGPRGLLALLEQQGHQVRQLPKVP